MRILPTPACTLVSQFTGYPVSNCSDLPSCLQPCSFLPPPLPSSMALTVFYACYAMLCKILLNSYKKVSLTNPTQIWLFLSFVFSKTRLYLHCIHSKVGFSPQLCLSVWGCCWEMRSNQDISQEKSYSETK